MKLQGIGDNGTEFADSKRSVSESVTSERQPSTPEFVV